MTGFKKLQECVLENDITGALAQVDKIFPLYDWVLAKGKVTELEPLYAFQLMAGNQVVSQGEDDDMIAAMVKAVAVALYKGTSS